MAAPRTPKPADANKDLAQQILSACAASGTMTPRRLVDLLAPAASLADVDAALQSSVCRTKWIVAIPGDVDSPLIAKDAIDSAVEGEALLEQAVRRLSSADHPVQAWNDVTAALAPSLRKPFDAFWRSRLEAGAGPQSIALVEPATVGDLRASLLIRWAEFEVPAARAARRLTEAVQQLRDIGGDSYPALWSAVLTRAGGAYAPDVVRVAWTMEPLKSQVRTIALIAANDPWVIQRADANDWVVRDEFLRRLLMSACSVDRPCVHFADVVSLISADLRAAFEQHWKQRFQSGAAPAFVAVDLVAVGQGAKRRQTYQLHDKRFEHPAERLARTLRDALDAARLAGGDRYPAPLSQLAAAVSFDAAEPDAAERLQAARQLHSFSTEIVDVATLGDESWWALRSDAIALLRRDDFLRRLLQTVCSADREEVDFLELAECVGVEFRDEFSRHWTERIAAAPLLPFASCRLESLGKGAKRRETWLIHDDRFQRPEARLAEQAIEWLQQKKKPTSRASHWTWRELTEAIHPGCPADLAMRAWNADVVRTAVTSALVDVLESPIALRDALSSLVFADGVLASSLDSVRRENEHAVEVDRLAKSKLLHADLAAVIVDEVRQAIAERTLPAELGALAYGKHWLLFRRDDVIVSASTTGRRSSKSTSAVPELTVYRDAA